MNLALDPDLLRSFVFIADEGSFTRAAHRVGRTQSAVSMQIQRLEGLLGQRLITRGKGGNVQLTPHGQFLLARARDLLALNDQIFMSFRSPEVQGTVRLGIPDDYALRYLPKILKRFAEAHPSVQVDVLCLPSHLLVEHLRLGDLDLTLCSDGQYVPPGHAATPLWRGQLSWITSESHATHRQDPLPVALSTNNRLTSVPADSCTWSTAARKALEAAGRRYRLAYSATTLIGTHAPVLAGLAVTVGTSSWLPEGLRTVRADEGLPPLPEFGILLLRGADARQPVTDALAEYITSTFQAEGVRSLAA